ncbi:two-component regulator propeller domain-containing protein [Flavobacterium hauense]
MKIIQHLLFITLLIHFSHLKAQENWTIYNSTNSGLPSNSINDIEFDNQGDKWISLSNNGIAKFDNNNWTIYNTSNGQGTSEVYKITYTTGELESWVSVLATTVIVFADGTQTTINSEHDYSTNILTIEIPFNTQSFTVEYYIEDSSETVEMSFFNTSTNQVIQEAFLSNQMMYNYDYTFYNNIITNLVSDISIDNQDNKWIGTREDGLIKFNDSNWANYNVSNSGLPNDKINCVTNDENGNVWIGSTSGLTKFDGSSWTTFNTLNSDLPDNTIISIAIDNEDNVWISTANALVKFSGISWNIYTNESFANMFGGANSLKIDSNGKKWISSNYGITSFDGTTWQKFDYFDSESCLIDCQNISVGIDKDNNIWTGAQQECSNGGLLNFTQCVDYVSSETPLPENTVMAINIDNEGNKWIGTLNGLAKLSSTPLSLEENGMIQAMVYPNPVLHILNIQIDEELNECEYSIVDVNGRIIISGRLINKTMPLNVDILNSGVYYIKISNNAKSRFIKFVK